MDCEQAKSTFYTQIIFPLVLFSEYILFIAYKLDTFYKKEPLPYWKVYLAALVTLSVYCIISFAVQIDNDTIPGTKIKCSRQFVVLFDILAFVYVILVGIIAPFLLVGYKIDNPKFDFYSILDYNSRFYTLCFWAAATIFLVIVRYTIFV